MNRILTLVLSAALLSGCGDGTNPFDPDVPDTPTTPTPDPDPDTPLIEGRDMPPGTPSPTPDTSIDRREARGTDEKYQGNGYAEGISYDGVNDTFTVDGLAFDGDNTYARSAPVGSLGTPGTVTGGPFAVYEADAQYNDDVTGAPVNQFTHRAIYGVGQVNGDTVTQFAIVRTGAYTGYGFGGFVYRRDNDVVLPSSGQANYTGQYAGLRDFDGRGGLEYVSGDMDVSIDFDDFNPTTNTRGDAVRGYVRNRQIYNSGGTNITRDILDQLEDDNQVSYSELPTLVFKVGPGVLDNNGEIIGNVNSTIATSDGVEVFEDGKYYAVVSGAGADQQIVGVIVVESEAPGGANYTVRETGGFILDR